MAIKIHHGPPGSYKTSGAVHDDFVKAAEAGRTIVTNVRGLDDAARIIDVLEGLGIDVPATFELIWVDTANQEGRDRIARWWHWVPHNAFIILDEAQMLFPASWRDPDLAKLAFPGGIDAAQRENRPAAWPDCWDMHRHYGWDFVLTTPSIKKIRPDIRGAAEMAFKHKNLALVGFKGSYLEGRHAAEDNGSSESDFFELRRRRVPSWVFDLYGSTATGDWRDTFVGLSLLANPRLLILLGIVGAVLALVFSRPLPAVLSGKGAGASAVAGAGSGGAVGAGGVAAGGKGGGVGLPSGRPDGSAGGIGVGAPADLARAALGAQRRAEDAYRVGLLERLTYRGQLVEDYFEDSDGRGFTRSELKAAGVVLVQLGGCLWQASAAGQTRYVECAPRQVSDDPPGREVSNPFAKS